MSNQIAELRQRFAFPGIFLRIVPNGDGARTKPAQNAAAELARTSLARMDGGKAPANRARVCKTNSRDVEQRKGHGGVARPLDGADQLFRSDDHYRSCVFRTYWDSPAVLYTRSQTSHRSRTYVSRTTPHRLGLTFARALRPYRPTDAK